MPVPAATRESFLIRAYFGPDPEFLRSCSSRAYRDFNRTLHGIPAGAREDGEKLLLDRLKKIKVTANPTQPVFNRWHCTTCKELSKAFGQHGFPRLTVGQAQKWINMTLKYVYVIGEDRIPGYEHLYKFCHAPLDRILIDALSGKGFEPLGCAWSRLDDYGEYLERQRWIRATFEKPPLDVDFELWNRDQAH